LTAAVKRKIDAAQHLPRNQFAVLPQRLPAVLPQHRLAAVVAAECSVVASLVAADLEAELLLLGFRKRFLTTTRTIKMVSNLEGN